MLIAHGHTPDAVHGYTLAQVRAFLRAIERMNSERRYGEALAMRMAQADGKVWGRYMRGLKNGG
ncbi:MAG: hypothetical protein AB7P94_16850 [Steroidobacteraceae bacterium]